MRPLALVRVSVGVLAVSTALAGLVLADAVLAALATLLGGLLGAGVSIWTILVSTSRQRVLERR